MQDNIKIKCVYMRTKISGRINTKLLKEVIYGGRCNGRWEYIELLFVFEMLALIIIYVF